MRYSLFRALSLLIVLSACARPPAPALTPTSSALYVFDLQKSALLEIAADFASVIKEVPLDLPAACTLAGLYPSPGGERLAVELACPNGPLTLSVDTTSGSAAPLLSDASMDSHFLAWSADGKAVYLRVDALGDARILSVDAASRRSRNIPIDPYTYHLAARPNGESILYAFSHGMGLGSELWLAAPGGGHNIQFVTDSQNILAFARWSPDGKSIAFIKIPDSQIPYTVGELWVMDAGGGNPLKRAGADAGHGYAPAWSPDGRRLAFVQRSNPGDTRADQSLEALVSNIAVVDMESGALAQVTDFSAGRAGAPVWSPDGNTLVFDYVLNGRMEVQIAALSGGSPSSLPTSGLVCCAVWLRK